MMWLSAVAVMFCTWFVWRHYFGPGSSIPGTFGMPFVGQTMKVLKLSIRDFAREGFKKHGNVFKTNFMGADTVFLNGPDLLRKCFLGEEKYVEANWFYTVRELAANNTLLMQSGHVHTQQRRLVLACLTPRHLSGYVPGIVAICRNHVAQWGLRAELKKFIDLYPLVREVSSCMIRTVVMGVRFNLLHGHEMAQGFNDIESGFMALPLPFSWTKYGIARVAQKKVYKLIDDEIHLRQTAEKKLQYNDMVQSLLEICSDEGPECMSMNVMKAQLMLPLFGGLGTTASTLCLCVCQLSKRPEIVTKIREEQNREFGEGWTDEAITYASLKKLVYLEAVIDEVARHHIVGQSIFRKCKNSFEVEGHMIPKGWTVALGVDTTNLGSKISKKDDFEPERFLEGTTPGDGYRPARWEYLPFGGGARACVGKELAKIEMKTLLSFLLRDYNLKTMREETSWFDGPVPIPQGGVPVELIPVNKTESVSPPEA